jgi:hypothetical protein
MVADFECLQTFPSTPRLDLILLFMICKCLLYDHSGHKSGVLKSSSESALFVPGKLNLYVYLGIAINVIPKDRLL